MIRRSGARQRSVPLAGAVVSLALATTALATTVLGAAAPPEFRGMWVTRFEWPDPDEAAAKAYIDEVMAKLAAGGFNAVLFQVRGQADTLYPSPDEPWSPLISPSGTDPGWDPLAYALEAAHAQGLEFHAYINTHVCWQSGSHTPPASPDHPYYEHCNAADPGARDWLIHDVNGTPVQYDESDYAWMAPGVPALQAYLRQQVMHVVRTYDVDGVHFDRIRTPKNDTATRSWSHDPISEARSAIGAEGNPGNLDFPSWSRDQFTRFLGDLYAEIMEVRPWVKISAAPLGLYRASRYPYPGYPTSDCGFLYGYTCVWQDAQAWLAAGAMDFIVPQIYWADGGAKPDFSEVLPDWAANDAGRHVYAGQNVGKAENTLAELLGQIAITRAGGAEGNVQFSFGGFDARDYWDDYAGPGGPYQEPAALPAMPWKDDPATGMILGRVLDDGAPVVDARVTRTGSGYTALASGDGLYSFLLVPPGTYTLSFTKPGKRDREIAGVIVHAGEVARIDVSMGKNDPHEPDPPQGLAAQSGDRLVALDWLDNAEPDLARYDVFRSTEGGPFEKVANVAAPRSDWSDATVANGASYAYVVRAVDLANNASDPSSEAAGSPVANPKEASPPGFPMTARLLSGGAIEVAYEPACGATDHAAYLGLTPIAGSPAWTTSVCGLGTSGIAVFDPGTPPPGRAAYFVIVGQHAAAEGSYGRDGAGAERPEAAGVGACDRPQRLEGVCP